MSDYPAAVAAGIVEVMSGIRTLGKDEKNTFQKYDFVSVDKFLGMVNPLCAKAGIFIVQDEMVCEIVQGDKSPWLKIGFRYRVAHKDGEATEWSSPRTVMVPANGAQAFGSAQSYSLKQYMRSLFQIPTGDKDDADHHEAQPLPQASVPLNGNNQPDWEKFSKDIETKVGAATEIEAINTLLRQHAPALDNLKRANPEIHKHLATLTKNKRGMLSQAPAEPTADWEWHDETGEQIGSMTKEVWVRDWWLTVESDEPREKRVSLLQSNFHVAEQIFAGEWRDTLKRLGELGYTYEDYPQKEAAE